MSLCLHIGSDLGDKSARRQVHSERRNAVADAGYDQDLALPSICDEFTARVHCHSPHTSLPLTCDPGRNGASGFSLSFAPRRAGPGGARQGGDRPGHCLDYIPGISQPPFDVLTHNVRPHVARTTRSGRSHTPRTGARLPCDRAEGPARRVPGGLEVIYRGVVSHPVPETGSHLPFTAPSITPAIVFTTTPLAA